MLLTRDIEQFVCLNKAVKVFIKANRHVGQIKCFVGVLGCHDFPDR